MNFAAQRFEETLNRNKINLARTAMMVDDLGQILAHDRAVVRGHATANLATFQPPEEQMIHIGDQHTHTQSSPPASTGMRPWVAGLIGAGLLASGVGIPAAAYLLSGALRPAPTQPNPATPGNLYQLRLLP